MIYFFFLEQSRKCKLAQNLKKDLFFYKSSNLIFIYSKLREIPYYLANILLVPYKMILILIFFLKSILIFNLVAYIFYFCLNILQVFRMWL